MYMCVCIHVLYRIGEWITGATCMYLVNHFVRHYEEDGYEEITELMDNMELVLVPFVNPDGYVVGVVNMSCSLSLTPSKNVFIVQYTWTNDRMWRKNRNPAPSTTCVGTGVDINRNFPEGFRAVSGMWNMLEPVHVHVHACANIIRKRIALQRTMVGHTHSRNWRLSTL